MNSNPPPFDLIVEAAGRARWNGRALRCAIGRGGVMAANLKREGDGATPIGTWPMREVFFRADRMAKPQTALPIRALEKHDGWCEDPADAAYNRLVRVPYPVPVDEMWREDHVYDIVVVLGHNDDPVQPGAGSAIFLHLARPGFSPTAGCVALNRDDLLTVLREAEAGSSVVIKEFS